MAGGVGEISPQRWKNRLIGEYLNRMEWVLGRFLRDQVQRIEGEHVLELLLNAGVDTDNRWQVVLMR